MKLLTITTIREYKEYVEHILKSLKIEGYTLVDAQGIKSNGNTHDLGHWFGTSSGVTEELMIWFLCAEPIAHQLIHSVDQFNQKEKKPFPIKAYAVHVELQSK